jgi:hypothetical protein
MWKVAFVGEKAKATKRHKKSLMIFICEMNEQGRDSGKAGGCENLAKPTM